MNRIRLLIAVSFVGGCTLGPAHQTPDAPPADAWVAPVETSAATALPEQWWSSLEDEQLNEYLAVAATRNLDLRIATQRVEEARAARGIARSVLWPQLGANARYTDVEQSVASPAGAGSLIEAGLVDRSIDFYNASLDASWEIDLFGGNRRRAEAAAASLLASAAERDAVRLSVLAETASAYFELRGAQQRLAIVNSNIAAQQRTLDVTGRKVEAGLARKIDALRAQAQLDGIRAQLPALRAAIRASNYRLGVLTGRAPQETRDEIAVEAGLPEVPASVAAGMPADMLRRRPDIVAAEQRLAAATAGIGVATAEFFPRLVLSASYGFESDSAGELGESRARTTALVPFATWPILQGGRLRANLEGANARAMQAALAYERTVLQALADAESALSAFAEERETLERLTAAARASREAADIAQKLYERGLADFLTVLDADRRRDEAEELRAQSHTRAMLNLVGVYKSLGGGWRIDDV